MQFLLLLLFLCLLSLLLPDHFSPVQLCKKSLLWNKWNLYIRTVAVTRSVSRPIECFVHRQHAVLWDPDRLFSINQHSVRTFFIVFDWPLEFGQPTFPTWVVWLSEAFFPFAVQEFPERQQFPVDTFNFIPTTSLRVFVLIKGQITF